MSARVGLRPSYSSGIIIPVSSKTGRLQRRQVARLQRREAARVRRARRLRKDAWAQHTRAERRRAAAERWRQRQRDADQRREKLLGRAMLPLAIGVGVPALVFLGPSGAAVTGAHHSYPMVSLGSLGGVGLPAGPDVPHLPEPGMTYYTPMVTAGTAVSTAVRVPGEQW